jgi:acyl-CoA synthetase (AMP-forming)/AMP-acid ligase II
VVVLASGQQAADDLDLADELREFCKSLIGGYKIPRSFEVVDELPLSAAGKVLKRELRAKYWTGSDRSVG